MEKKKHGDKYKYDKVTYKDMLGKITIICSEHRGFKQDHYAYTRFWMSKMQIKTAEQFIKDALDVHSNLYDYSKTQYERWTKPVIIICKKFNN